MLCVCLLCVCVLVYPLPANMDPVVPSVVVTAIVIAGLVAGIVAIPAYVWLKKRKKTTAPVGGAQDQGKYSNSKLLH